MTDPLGRPVPADPGPRCPAVSPLETDLVYLMRIGAVGTEKPVARIDDETYVDLSDAVTDFDEAF